jgi:D-glutamate cyclase
LATEDEQAKVESEELLDAIRPDLVVAVERAGRNSRGVYHNARGMDYGEGRARADLLVTAAQARDVPVVAVGDGGNEIGMGLVSQAVIEHVAFGRECVCGCGGGMGSEQVADALVVAGCSNWGCYGITGALGILLGRVDVVHTAAMEGALLDASASAGLIDSASGLSSDSVDGFPRSTHEAMSALIHDVASRGVVSR